MSHNKSTVVEQEARLHSTATFPNLAVFNTRWRDMLLLFCLSLAVILAYWPGLYNKPVAEDFAKPEAFLRPAPDRQFRPVFAAAMLSIRSIAGPYTQSPLAYHLFCLGIHLAATLAVFWLARQLGQRQSVAITAALLFALYPRNHEAIFWTAASSHTIMTVFILYSLIYYIKGGLGKGRKWMVASYLLFCLGLLSAEGAIVSVALFALYDILWHQYESKSNWVTNAVESLYRLLPYMAFTVIYSGLVVLGRGIHNLSNTTSYHVQFNASQIKDFGGYLSYTLLPFIPLRTFDSMYTKVVVLTVTLVVLGYLLLRGSKLTKYGVAWIMITVTPYVLFVPFGNADRYFYAPAVGFCFVVVGAWQTYTNMLASHVTRRKLQLSLGIALSAVAVYSVVGFHLLQKRSQEWRTAGDMVDKMLAQIYSAHSSMDPQTVVYILDLPKQYGQAKFMGVGMRPALQTHYNMADLTVNTSDDPELVAAVEYAHHERLQYDKPVYVYVYVDDTLVDYSASLYDPNVRTLLETRATLP